MLTGRVDLKKKKCDEKRPQCSRCLEHGVECAYEAIKPRQRRRKDSQSGLKIDVPLGYVPLEDTYEWEEQPTTPPESECFSPLETTSVVSLSSYVQANVNDNPTSPPYEAEADETKSQKQITVRRESSYLATPSSARSLPPELAMISPCPVGSPTLEFRMPAFSEFSDRRNRRALVDHFCNVLSHLIVFREESGNPFQQLVLPLSHTSSPVMNAIYALASAHLEYRGVQNAEKSLYFHNQAIQGLARIIESQVKVNKNELLAAIMLLVYYEVVGVPDNIRGISKTKVLILFASQFLASTTWTNEHHRWTSQGCFCHHVSKSRYIDPSRSLFGTCASRSQCFLLMPVVAPYHGTDAILYRLSGFTT